MPYLIEPRRPIIPRPANEAEAARLEALRAVEEAGVLQLAGEDQVRFAKALIEPPLPGARLARAAKRHADLIAPGEQGL